MKTITFPKFTPERRAAPGQVVNTVPHHWQNCALKPLAKPFTRGGVRFTHRMPWYLDKVEGCTRSVALKAIYGMLKNPKGWIRSGVQFVRVFKPADAQMMVRVIPQDTTVCGKGAAGCWSWDGAGLPVAEVGVEYVNDPVSFATVLGMELCGHGTFNMLDMYNVKHQPYAGSMGTWQQAAVTNGLPSDDEVADARRWLAGQTANIHDD